MPEEAQPQGGTDPAYLQIEKRARFDVVFPLASLTLTVSVWTPGLRPFVLIVTLNRLVFGLPL